MRAPEGIAFRQMAHALRPEPALMIAHDLAAVGAVFQVGRNLRLRHSPPSSAIRTIRERNAPLCIMPNDGRVCVVYDRVVGVLRIRRRNRALRISCGSAVQLRRLSEREQPVIRHLSDAPDKFVPFRARMRPTLDAEAKPQALAGADGLLAMLPVERSWLCHRTRPSDNALAILALLIRTGNQVRYADVIAGFITDPSAEVSSSGFLKPDNS